MFFSHRPAREGQNKQFVRQDYAKHRRVAEAFYRHARRAVHNSGLPVVEATDERQRGNGFGPRFANAVADAFAQGYEHVIAVGSDCPRLHEVDWAAVADTVADGTPVLGPTAGQEGTYLMGLSREQFDRDSFEALPWTTPALLPALQQYLERQSGRSPRVLPVRDDVNGHRELLALVQHRTRLPVFLRVRLRRVLGIHLPAPSSRPPSSEHVGGHRRSRAPPLRSSPHIGADCSS
ncbi:MAG: DUF2064 domain-containing protein [Bacteroidetes bacterium SW_9_63_38]|nr:MAG: DUF2064 domain-containing protein [Bacteroidetes bacterium SW_9_63_38]